MRFLAIDLGDKRTGLALADDQTRIASPLSVIDVPADRRDALIDALDDAAHKHEADALVIGLPLNMDGTEGPRAAVVRDLAGAIAARIHLPLHLHDERLSSADADWSMARTGMTHKQKKARRDALAAAAILKDFLEAHP